MEGIVYLLNLTGAALSKAHADADALRAENDALRERVAQLEETVAQPEAANTAPG